MACDRIKINTRRPGPLEEIGKWININQMIVEIRLKIVLWKINHL